MYSIDRWYATNALVDSLDEYDTLKDSKKKKPPYDGQILGDDPSKCPGEGFEWRGNATPESGKGSWVKGTGKTKKTLHPDLDHPLPKGPHWDYDGPDFPNGTRIFPNGTWENK